MPRTFRAGSPRGLFRPLPAPAASVSAPAAVATVTAAAVVAAFAVSALAQHGIRDLAPYNLGEFLISYQGGFVRRGLFGEILYRLSPSADQAHIEQVIIASSVFAYGCCFALVWRWLIRYSGSAIITLLVILQPFLFAFPILEFQWIRKDCFLLLAFYASAIVLGRGAPMRFVVVNFVSIIAILTHESYGFSFLPLLALLAAAPVADTDSPIRRIARSIGRLTPSLLTFALVLVRHGNALVADRIIGSWQARGVFLYDQPDPRYRSAVRALAQSAGEASSTLWQLVQAAQDGNWIVPAYWLAAIPISATALCIAAVYRRGSRPSPCRPTDRMLNRDFKEASACLSITGCCFAPLFVLGLDFGRWVFLWLAASLAIVFTDRRSSFLSTVHGAMSPSARSIARRTRQALFGPLAALFGFGSSWASPLTAMAVTIWCFPMPIGLISKDLFDLAGHSLVARLVGAIAARW